LVSGFEEHERKIADFKRSNAGQSEQDQARVSGQVGEVAVRGEEVEDGAKGARQAAQKSVTISTPNGQT
jgi:hypothetical protein